MTDRTTIGQNIAALRKQAGLTQTELADKLHVSHQAISQWERAETLPDILTLPALAEIFGERVGVILGMDEKDPAENSLEMPAQITDPVEKAVGSEIQQEYRSGMLDENGE
ncbi:MAG: helix-turn-helix transcriptional regulator, partial [Clostridia bacterium]|nr:helix-turn-helix transcriptional regulator [Clostridia bacterium]